MGRGPTNPVPVNIRIVHIHENPINEEAIHTRGSPVNVGIDHIH